MENIYFLQTKLLTNLLPFIAEDPNFSLKGGTAINLFLRDLPRFSVDIDLTYLPIQDRSETLNSISASLEKLAERIRCTLTEVTVHTRHSFKSTFTNKLSVDYKGANVIIEPNFTIRGHVYPCQILPLTPAASSLFGKAFSTKIMSSPDIYGGKICAALDRQHPRDLFDIKLLLDTDGISEQTRKAFIVYLISGNRPLHEILNPHRLDVSSQFYSEFKNMHRIDIDYTHLLEARESLIQILHHTLTENERQFLLSLQQGTPDWPLLSLSNISNLPSVQWKLLNIQKMDKEKRQQQYNFLKKVLYH